MLIKFTNSVCNVNDCKQKHCKHLHSSIVKPTLLLISTLKISESSHIMMPIVPIIVSNSYAIYALLHTGSSPVA